jgi:hypothetical protein
VKKYPARKWLDSGKKKYYSVPEYQQEKTKRSKKWENESFFL